MAISTGTHLGPYEILAPIGAGGMGEVYRARDARLGREVAIKVLPSSFSTDADRLRRFEQEAKAAGVLNHPNITAVYDIGTASDGAPYVVQELLEGETLRSELAGGRFSPRKAIETARQIAEGLAAAHEKGIVHRDLKPENVFVTRDGRVKILDFGLAKLTHQEEGSQTTNLPTATAGTEPGVVLGTLGYMSPEQVRGKPADARSDIFSFGAILYEMLSGKRAFHGDSAADTMSAILREDPPDLSVTDQSISPGLDRVVRHCLEKNPGQRFQSARDLAFNLDALSAPSGAAAQTPGKRSWRARPAMVSGAIGMACLLAGAGLGRLTAPGTPDPPEIRSLTSSGRDWEPAASPDGKTVAFTSDRDGPQRIWIKQIAGGGEAALTDGHADGHPRFSPDGASVLFARFEADAVALYRVALVGGEPRRLVADAFEGDWSPDGSRIAFLRRGLGAGPISRVGVAASDGSGARVIAEYQNSDLRRPRWTPDGSAIVAVQGPGAGTTPGVIHWISADGRERRVLSAPESRGELSSIAWSRGRMLYMQGAASTSNSRTVTGRLLLQEPGSRRADVLLHVPNFGSTLDILESGRLVFDADFSRQTLREVAPAGRVGSPPPRWLTRGKSSDRQPAYSPDGQRIVFASDRDSNLDIWEIALKNGALRRLTDDPAEDWDPSFSPDGRSLLWSSNRNGHFEIWISEADGSDARQLTHDGVDAENPEMTPDGHWVTYTSSNPARMGLWKIHPDGSGDARLVAGNTVHPEISPDGAYVICHLPNVAAHVVRLADGKVLPFTFALHSGQVGRSRWFPDGKSVAFVGMNEAHQVGVFAQEFSTVSADTSATRRPIAGFDPSLPTESFGISPDGSRIVLSEVDPSNDILIAEGLRGIARPRKASR
jgi:Tol biopolymer transport system component